MRRDHLDHVADLLATTSPAGPPRRWSTAATAVACAATFAASFAFCAISRIEAPICSAPAATACTLRRHLLRRRRHHTRLRRRLLRTRRHLRDDADSSSAAAATVLGGLDDPGERLAQRRPARSPASAAIWPISSRLRTSARDRQVAARPARRATSCTSLHGPADARRRRRTQRDQRDERDQRATPTSTPRRGGRLGRRPRRRSPCAYSSPSTAAASSASTYVPFSGSVTSSSTPLVLRRVVRRVAAGTSCVVAGLAPRAVRRRRKSAHVGHDRAAGAPRRPRSRRRSRRRCRLLLEPVVLRPRRCAPRRSARRSSAP